jgi:hypothetical protein
LRLYQAGLPFNLWWLLAVVRVALLMAAAVALVDMLKHSIQALLYPLLIR